MVRAYRLCLSPALGRNCRYEPSCSTYALDALRLHGAVAGSCLGAYRVLRCHPGCRGGGDPVPDQLPAWLRWLQPAVSAPAHSAAVGAASPFSSNPSP